MKYASQSRPVAFEIPSQTQNDCLEDDRHPEKDEQPSMIQMPIRIPCILISAHRQGVPYHIRLALWPKMHYQGAGEYDDVREQKGRHAEIYPEQEARRCAFKLNAFGNQDGTRSSESKKLKMAQSKQSSCHRHLLCPRQRYGMLKEKLWHRDHCCWHVPIENSPDITQQVG